MIIKTITIKSWLGSYNTSDYKFKTEEDYQKWYDKHMENHKLGKIIGIINTIEL